MNKKIIEIDKLKNIIKGEVFINEVQGQGYKECLLKDSVNELTEIGIKIEKRNYVEIELHTDGKDNNIPYGIYKNVIEKII